MPATIEGSHLGPGTHAARPAANADGQPIGAQYSCTDHGLVYQSDGSSWSTWATLGGAAVTDATISISDVTTNNASTSKHGWLKKLSGVATQYMDGTGAWSVPAGGGGGGGAFLDALALAATYGDEFDGPSLNGRWTGQGAFDAQAAQYAVAGSWLQVASRGAAETIYQTGPTKETFEVITKHFHEGVTGHMVGPAIVSATGAGVACALRFEISQFVIVNVASYAYTGDGANMAVGGGNAVMDYMRGLPIWLSLRHVPTALDGIIYFARYSLNGSGWGRTIAYDPATFTYAKTGWGLLNGSAADDQVAIDRFNIVDALDIGDNLCVTPVGGGTVTATASSSYPGFGASRAIDGTSNDWSANDGAADYAGAGLYLDIAWSVGQTMNRVVVKERAGNVFGKAHLEITHSGGTATIALDSFIGGSSKWHVKDFSTLTGVTAVRIVSDGVPGANCGFMEVETYYRS